MKDAEISAHGSLLVLLSGVAAHADSLYYFNGVLQAYNGSYPNNPVNAAVTGTFTWNGSTITSWNLDFSSLAGLCGYACQLGGMQAFSTIGNGYVMAGSSSASNDTQAGHDSYPSYQNGLTNTILTVAGMNGMGSTYSTQVYFDFNAIPGTFNTLGGNSAFIDATLGNGNQDDFMRESGSATLVSPEPPSAVLMLTVDCC